MTGEEKKSLEFWEKIHRSRTINSREDILTDEWLFCFDRWIGSCERVLDLGCGDGNDTRIFLEMGKSVTACDQSETSIGNIKRIFPEVKDTRCLHMPDAFGFEDNSFDVICADLSLHYFTESDTFSVIKELVRILVPDGYLLVRVNSVNDVNHGAGMGEEIEPHLYRTEDGMLKRFFDKKDVLYFFSSFDILFCEEQDMCRYRAPKKVYTLCLQNKKDLSKEG